LRAIEKVHSIFICPNQCRIDISNMDIMDHAIEPVLEQLANTIQSIIYSDLPITDLFLIGHLLNGTEQWLNSFLSTKLNIHPVSRDARLFGAAIYGTAPHRHLLERVASKGYAIAITQTPKSPSIEVTTASGDHVQHGQPISLLQKHDLLPHHPIEQCFHLSESLNIVTLKGTHPQT
jgi:hypothetical protein